MAFSDDQIGHLRAKLSRSRVAQRQQGGGKVSYVEGWHCIAEANRIFGFDAWDRETIELRQLGEARQVGDKARVAYAARVRLTVRASGLTIVREGCGFGSGIDKDVGQAHESALKEAETDAMKRALMTFGNPFGLALYDKTQANVGDDPPEDEGEVEDPEVTVRLFIADCERAIDAEQNRTALIEWWNGDQRKEQFRRHELREDEAKALAARVTARAAALTAGNTRAAA